MRVTVYGEGGFDPSKKNNNIVNEYDVPDPDPTPAAQAQAVLQTVVDADAPNPSVQDQLDAIATILTGS